MSEIPVHPRPRRLADWINPTGARKVHSLVDKVYKRKNLEMAWEKVKANRGSGGVDGQSLEAFAAQLDQQLDRLHRELKEDAYQPQPVRQVQIPKAGQAGRVSHAGNPDDLSIGYASKRCSTGWSRSSSRYSMKPTSDIGEGDRRRMPCARCGRRFKSGREWIVDADLKRFFRVGGS